MKKKLILFVAIISTFISTLPAQHVYYVATNGDDNAAGDLNHPFATWQKAVLVSLPGDTTYIRGGIYKPTNYLGYSSAIGMSIRPKDGVGASGTKKAPICYFNYPGESPILDGSLMTTNQHGWLGGIDIQNAEYIHLRGLTVRNIHQSPPDFSRTGKPYSEVFGIGSSGANIHYENMVSHDIDGRGFQHWSGAWSDTDALYAIEIGYQTEYMVPDFASDSTQWINCDAYNLFDRYAEQPGNAADGWKVHGYYGNYYSWEGCRAFNYSDDGFDPSGDSYRTFKNCWAMSTSKYNGLDPAWNIEGNGFKITAVDSHTVPDYVPGERSFVRIENCIAANCLNVGFLNDLYSTRPDGHVSNGAVFYNNLSYKNEFGYCITTTTTFRNNIVYMSQGTGPVGERSELDSYLAHYTESNNSWIANDPSPGSHPWWYYNPAFNLTDDDFESLDYWQLTAQRKPDGSLPDIAFGHLKKDSELIDAGADVGLPFYGTAPDVGVFEYDPSAAEVPTDEFPGDFQLFGNYPNPFYPTTTIKYVIPANPSYLEPLQVSLAVYNLLGQVEATLVNELQLPGNYEETFDASGLASGIYLYRLQAGSFSAVKKLMVLK